MGLTILLLVLEAAVGPAQPVDHIDGRADPPSWRNEALAVPRILLAPPRLLFRALEYPIGASAAWNEREHAFGRLVALVTWRNGRIGVRPAFQFTRDFRPLVGATAFLENVLGPGTRVSSTLLTSGRSALLIDLGVRPTPGRSPVAVDIEGHYLHRDDLLFSGIPSISPPGVDLPDSRFSMHAVDLVARVSWRRGPWTVGGDTRYGWRAYSNGTALSDDQGIEQVYCQRILGRCVYGQIDQALVPGYVEGTQFLRWRATVDVDTRHPAFGPASGVFAGVAFAFSQTLSADRGRYFGVTAAVGGSINLWRRVRYLVLRLATETLVTLDGTTPFSEIPYLGGPDDLRGFRFQRFRDYSNLVLNIEYRWQIWQWADAGLFFDLGTTGGRGYKGSFDQVHPDLGLAIRLRTSGRFLVRLQLAYGFSEGGGFQFAILGEAGP